MKWINVKDKLPPDNVDYLSTDGTYIYLVHHQDPFYSKAILALNFKQINEYVSHELRGLVTHWMPLPEPPPNDPLTKRTNEIIDKYYPVLKKLSET